MKLGRASFAGVAGLLIAYVGAAALVYAITGNPRSAALTLGLTWLGSGVGLLAWSMAWSKGGSR